MKHRVLARADRDIDGIVNYFVQFNAFRSADRFIIRVQQAILKVADNPGLGASCEATHPQLQAVKYLHLKGFAKYVVYYRVHNETVEVLRVLHGARDFVEQIRQVLDD